VIFFSLSVTAVGQPLDSFRWKSRLVLLFTPASDNPMFEQQARLLNEQTDALEERDIIVLFITPERQPENTAQFLPEADALKLYERFDTGKHQFVSLLVGLDGGEKFRAQNRVIPPSVLIQLIDGMPMRRRELLREKENKSKGG